MKLMIFDRTSSDSAICRAGVRSLNINRGSGAITLSRTAAKEMGVIAGQSVVLAQDEEKPDDWYVCFSAGENGFTVRMKNSGHAKGGEEPLYITCKAVAHRILDTVKVPHSATLLISPTPVKADGLEWYKIVTAKPLRKR